jgi:hypothetical protein
MHDNSPYYTNIGTNTVFSKEVQSLWSGKH